MKIPRGKQASIKPRLRDPDSVRETPADMRVRQSLKECLRQAIEDERAVIGRYLDPAHREISRKKPPKSA